MLAKLADVLSLGLSLVRVTVTRVVMVILERTAERSVVSVVLVKGELGEIPKKILDGYIDLWLNGFRKQNRRTKEIEEMENWTNKALPTPTPATLATMVAEQFLAAVLTGNEAQQTRAIDNARLLRSSGEQR